MTQELVYYHPEIFSYGGKHIPVHRLELRQDIECLGFVDSVYRSDPMSHFYLEQIYIQEPHRQKGYAWKLLQSFNDFLLIQGKMGLLRNIIPENTPGYNIYRKSGWREIDDLPRWYVFNEIPGLDKDLIIRAIIKSRLRAQRCFAKYIPEVE